MDAAGDLYGTTSQGGAHNDGTAFELVKTAAGYSALVTLETFNGSNGSFPEASLISDAWRKTQNSPGFVVKPGLPLHL